MPSSNEEDEISYRTPRTVTEAVCFPRNLLFPRCPRCLNTMEREYQHYCDRCGQALSWTKYTKSLHIIKIR